MNLFILSIATILARSCVLANPGDNCETDNIQDDLTRLVVGLQIEGIYPDYLPSLPEGVLGVRWRTVEARLGNCINPLESLEHPFFELPDNAPEANSTLFVLGIDYPSRVASQGLTLSNLCINIVEKRFDTQTSGFSVAPFIGPVSALCSGSRRLVAFTFSQQVYIDPNNIELLQLGTQRERFDLLAFIDRYRLGNMTSANFWIADDCCDINFSNSCGNSNNNYCNSNNNYCNSNNNDCNSNRNGCCNN